MSVNSDIGLVGEDEVEMLEAKRGALVGPAEEAFATSRALIVPDAGAAEVQIPAPGRISYSRRLSRGIAAKSVPFEHGQRPETSAYTQPEARETFSHSVNSSPAPFAPTPASAPPLLVTMAPVDGKRTDRLHGSMWALWRNGSSTRADTITGGRLGGSQTGLRIELDLTPGAGSRVVAYSRMSVALNRPASPEGAVGVAWQPARSIPISLASERRIALGDGARNANVVMAVGGFGPTRIAASLQAEGYAQTGMVGFRSNDLFMDGKLSVLSPIASSPVRVGASVSGGAQPQVERLDVGPEIQIRLPLPRAAARISIEWRERIAGLAAPASGLAVTLAGDF